MGRNIQQTPESAETAMRPSAGGQKKAGRGQLFRGIGAGYFVDST
jgi:hypothetical protein